MYGFIKVPRTILDNEAICKDAEHIGLYVYLLANACFTKGGYIVWNGEKRALEIGELVTSVRKIEKDTKIPRTKVSRILQLMKKWDIVGTATDGTRTLISIDLSAISKTELGTEVGHKRDTFKEKQDEKEKSSKREKEENKEHIKNVKIPPISPEGEECFNKFWAMYPRKTGKGIARKSFNKIKITPSLLEKILATLAWQKKSREWTIDGGRYIPMPSTWLNQERWNDEQMEISNNENIEYGVLI